MGVALRSYAYIFKPNQLPFVFVPQRERQRAAGLAQRDDRHVMKERILVVTLLQLVVRDLRADVVHVMHADVAREPRERLRQLEVRTCCT